MQVHAYKNETDYGDIASWWIQRESIIPSKKLFSKHGLVVSKDGNKVCAIFLYPVNGAEICVLGWPVSNPSVERETRNEAMDLLFEQAHTQAKEMGYTMIWTTSGTKPIQDRLAKHGYTDGDTNINQYWKGL